MLALKRTSTRSFGSSQLVKPQGELQFVDHPRHGRVYPVLSLNHAKVWWRTARFSTLFSTSLNTSIFYHLFVSPFYIPAVAAHLCSPLFLLPLLTINYFQLRRYYHYFTFKSYYLTNMYLKPNGRQVVLETLDGNSTEVNNADFFDLKQINNNYIQKLEVSFGSNNSVVTFGPTFVMDNYILAGVLDGATIDVNNPHKATDLTQKFTWDF